MLNLISERTDAMRETLIKNEEQYRNIMPLLISARTLLETAAALGARRRKRSRAARAAEKEGIALWARNSST